jgi:glutathione S-transferase
MTKDADIEITAFDWVPEIAQGKVKDMRVRWALDEIGLPYGVRLVGGAGSDKSAEHLAEQPFGQVPVYKEGDLTLFESGAILLHVGEKDERLLPGDEIGRARAIGWMFAALNSVEPYAQVLSIVGRTAEGKDWQDEAKDAVRPYLIKRLVQLSSALDDREWLEGRFTLGDLLMIDVLRTIAEPDLVSAHSNLAAYVARGQSRPAFQSALTAHMAVFCCGR